MKEMLMSYLIAIKARQLDERGLSMLEYAAGAAVIIGIVYGAMNLFGLSMQNFITELGYWLDDKANDINAAP